MTASPTFEELGQIFLSKIIKTEVIHLDRFAVNAKVEFRLCLLDQTFKIIVPAEGLGEEQATQVWTEIFSSFLATFNEGLVGKMK